MIQHFISGKALIAGILNSFIHFVWYQLEDLYANVPQHTERKHIKAFIIQNRGDKIMNGGEIHRILYYC